MAQAEKNPGTDTKDQVIPSQDEVKTIMARIGRGCNYDLRGVGPFSALARCKGVESGVFDSDSQTGALMQAFRDLEERLQK